MSNLFKRLTLAAFGMVCLAATVGEASAGAFTRGCAARDLQILMLIEQREDVASQQEVISAIQTMLHARIVCHEGRVVDALRIYDTIAQTLTPDLLLTREIN